jgi:hypothetical protein
VQIHRIASFAGRTARHVHAKQAFSRKTPALASNVIVERKLMGNCDCRARPPGKVRDDGQSENWIAFPCNAQW